VEFGGAGQKPVDAARGKRRFFFGKRDFSPCRERVKRFNTRKSDDI